MPERLKTGQEDLGQHRLYQLLDSPEAVRVFMEHHCFAVWDFMTLLKALQRRLTCVELPWRPSSTPAEAVRFINEIVVGEESDLDAEGKPSSHYEMYLRAMEEVGADTRPIREFVATQDTDRLPKGVRPFVEHHLALAEQGTDEEVAAAFLYGREKLIPEMFTAIVAALGERRAAHCPQLVYYLERHIELDGDEHGPMAERLLDYLIGGSELRRDWAITAGLKSLEMRKQLWDATASAIRRATEKGDLDERQTA